MAFEDLLLRGAAWASLLAWAASELLRTAAHRPAGERGVAARAAFTVGGVGLFVHSALAFHVRYGWSQAVALEDTLRQTMAVTGLSFGGGLFVNYVFLLLWAAEIAWWWAAPTGYLGRSALLDRSLRGFFLFMFVNGAVVFVAG